MDLLKIAANDALIEVGAQASGVSVDQLREALKAIAAALNDRREIGTVSDWGRP